MVLLAAEAKTNEEITAELGIGFHHHVYSIEGSANSVVANSGAKPEFFRPGDSKRLFGISRAMMYQWLADGRIESKVIRQRGKLTGIRLINYDSAKAYIDSQLQGGAGVA